jgi:hypothetical protein
MDRGTDRDMDPDTDKKKDKDTEKYKDRDKNTNGHEHRIGKLLLSLKWHDSPDSAEWKTYDILWPRF